MSSHVARSVLQQCIGAKLMVKPASETSAAEYVHIKTGVVIFVCFMKGATAEILPKMVKSLCEVKLSPCSETKKRLSILDLPGDILVIPQATLGGKMKGKAIQYHENIDKELGKELYYNFVKLAEETFEANKSKTPNECTMQHGTYGNLQVLSMDTNGPYTHVVEF